MYYISLSTDSSDLKDKAFRFGQEEHQIQEKEERVESRLNKLSPAYPSLAARPEAKPLQRYLEGPRQRLQEDSVPLEQEGRHQRHLR